MMLPAPPPAPTPGYQPVLLPPPFMAPWGWAGYLPMAWPGMAAYPGSMPLQPPEGAAAAAAAGTAAAAAAGGAGGGQHIISRPRKQKHRKQRQEVVQEAASLSDEEEEAAADSSDDDSLTEHNQPAADGRPAQVAKVVYKVRRAQCNSGRARALLVPLLAGLAQYTKVHMHARKPTRVYRLPVQVLATPRRRGSRMRVNPTVVKQLARQVAPLGLPLWRQLVAAGSGSSSTDGRLSLTPAQIRVQLTAYAAQSDTNQQFVQQPGNRNLANHLSVLSPLLSRHDDPLTIAGSEVWQRGPRAWVGVCRTSIQLIPGCS